MTMSSHGKVDIRLSLCFTFLIGVIGTVEVAKTEFKDQAVLPHFMQILSVIISKFEDFFILNSHFPLAYTFKL